MYVDFSQVPAELKVRRQWVMWKQIIQKSGKPTKMPFQANGSRHTAKSNDPGTWQPFDAAASEYRNNVEHWSGIGYMFSSDDPYVGVDLDDCFDAETSIIAEWARPILAQFSETYAEISPSGTGIKLWAKGKLPTSRTGKKREVRNDAGQVIGAVEMYQRGRYFAVTGRRLANHMSEIMECQSAIENVWHKFLGASQPSGRRQCKSSSLVASGLALDRCRNCLAKLPPAISGKGGHNQTFAAACYCFRFGLTMDQAFELLREYNTNCEPQWTDDELRHKLDDAFARVNEDGQFGNMCSRQRDTRDGGDGQGSADARGGNRGDSFPDVESCGITELWHTSNRESWATVLVGNHNEHLPIRSRQFKDRVSEALFRNANKILTTKQFDDFRQYCSGQALYNGVAHTVHVRIAKIKQRLYLDLCDSDGRVVEITPDGWKVDANVYVRFYRAPGMQPLPLPTYDGNFDAIRSLLRVSATDWALIAGWLLMTLHPTGPYALLSLTGEKGTSKSFTAKALRTLVDPNSAPLRRLSRNGDDLMIAAANSHVLAFDNLSAINAEMSDDFCRVLSGGGMSKRRLFTDCDEVLIDVARPIIVTGIGDLITRDDLLDRAVIVKLQPFRDESRLTEVTLWERFDACHGATLGALCTAASAALKNENRQPANDLPRMADFVHFVSGGEVELGLRPGEFAESFHRSCSDANELVLENSEVGTAIIALMRSHPLWTGNYSDLQRSLYQKGVGSFDNSCLRSPVKLKRPGTVTHCYPRSKSLGNGLEHLF